ncbi:DUF6878 family protein [Falsiroseomonas sp. CW058]|uniref:DUF6878 family protein n=1 Tax=Falsiroseomonas sp. CW058 TaxID=3388664 RepID=UPI003D320A45
MTISHDTTRESNKNEILDALRSAGVGMFEAKYDGFGDSGQIEEISAEIPGGVTVRYLSHTWEGEIAAEEVPLAEAIERLCYSYLSALHGGWEINEGSTGIFTFDPEGRYVSLDHGDRVESVEWTSHGEI